MALLLGLVPFSLGALIVVVLGIRRKRLLSVILVFAFLLRAGLAFTHAYVAPLPDSQADAAMFERVGWEWAGGGWNSLLKNFTTGAYLYSWIIAFFYLLTDHSPLMIQGINVVLGILNVYLTWLITFYVSRGNGKAAAQAGWLAALWPTLNLYSALTMREPFVVFFELLGVYLMLVWWRKDRIRYALGAAFAFTASMAFHTGMMVLLVALVGAAAVRWFNALLQNSGRTFVRTTVTIGILLILGIAVTSTSFGLEKAGSLREGLGAYQEIAARGRGAYLHDVVVRTPMDLLWVTPIRMGFFLFAPFPWMAREASDVIGLIDASLYLVLFCFIMVRSREVVMNRALFMVAGIVMLAVAVFALGTSNYGTAIRHRAKIAPLLIVVAVVVQHENACGRYRATCCSECETASVRVEYPPAGDRPARGLQAWGTTSLRSLRRRRNSSWRS